MARNQSCARALLGLFVATALLVTTFRPAAAQNTGTIQGKVIEATTQRPVAGAQVTLSGTNRGMLTNEAGDYLFTAVRPGEQRVRVQFLGYSDLERTVRVTAGQTTRADFQLTQTAISLDALEVTALGQMTTRRELGTAQQTVRGAEIAQTQRENFVNALQGRIAGVEVVSSSGVPGASTSITIRGVSSISGSNQPLIIVDGLPLDNQTVNANLFENPQAGFANRGIDFTNRGADLNSGDIETLTVLKGPEAAALYGIDAANGAIVITTKRGRPGVGGFEYSNSLRVESMRGRPEVQRVYGPSAVGSTTFLYFGTPYPQDVKFYDNISSFFDNSFTQRHNLSFSGAAANNDINYRVSASTINQKGVVPTSKLDRINVTGASQARVTDWLRADVIMQYMTDENHQPFKGAGGPLIGLLMWPDTIDATDYLTPQGTRKRLTTLSAAAEVDNPFFSVRNNFNNSKTNRLNVNFGVTLIPFSWGSIKTNIGSDNYTTASTLHRHPESALGVSNNGILDLNDVLTRNFNAQTLFNINRREVGGGFSVSGMLGNSIRSDRTEYHAMNGRDFLYPNFISINNTVNRSPRTNLQRRRLVGVFGQAVVDYNNYLFVTVTGRNDWTSTIPEERNSFFYPSISTSFVFSDAVPSIGRFMSGKVRAAYAEVGKDARPYAYTQALEFKTTAYGGFGYGFWGPNPNLSPEFAASYEFGADLGFLNDRLGIEATFYRKQTRDQIVNDVRASYGTGFILVNLNGARTRNDGIELTLRATPLQTRNSSWNMVTNFTRARGVVLSLPEDLPESYNSDTWLYGNVRNGTRAGASIMSMTGLFYLRNNRGDLLIDPTTGLPARSSTFIDVGYDRQPDFLIGITNTFRHKRASLSFLADIRKGGDVFNATQHFLTARGMSTLTLDRERPRVIPGVLRDGKENTANPTPNNIVIVPAVQTGYYTGMSEELFIEQDINWLRLRDVTLRYTFPRILNLRNVGAFVTATDLFLLTNYSGMDPIVNGNTAALGGSGGVGIDYGNFPMPRGFNFGINVGF